MKRNLIVGVSVGLGGIEVVLTSPDFEIVERASRPLPNKITKEAIATRIEKAITSLSRCHEAYVVGICLPATFDKEGKKIISSVFKGLEGVNLYQQIVKKISVPIFIFRRSFCSLLAERAFGPAKDVKDAIYVEIGQDIEAAFLVGGKIYRGASGAAGQIAPMIVDITREKRTSSGDFRALISGEGIRALTGKSVYEVLRDNPKSQLVTQQILRDLKESILTGFYNLKLLFDPELFIVGGDLVENFSLFKSSFAGLGVKVVKSELGKDAPALGSAIAAFNSSRKSYDRLY